jgi:SNF2 family DNA or RNA helicase
MIFTPRPHQLLMLGHALNVPRCALWAGMGLGKTSTTLTALDYLFLSGEDRPALVLAPLRVARSTWPNEVEKWDSLRHITVSPVVGSEDERLGALRTDASVYTMNYDNLPWLVEHYRDRWPFGTIVSDESTRLKSFRLRQGGRRAHALGRVAHKHARRFIELTGTPSPNGLKDLWGQVWFLDAGQRLGRTFDSFKQRWFRPTYDGFGIEPLPFAQEQIEDKLRDLCLSLRSEDYFDVAKPIMNTILIDLPPKARRQYKSMEDEMFAQIESKGVEAFNAAARSMKCRQLASGAIYTDPENDRSRYSVTHDAKLEALDDVIEEAAGMPVLIAYHFKHTLDRLRKAYPKLCVFDADPQTEADWNAGKIPLLAVHPKSAGHGLNLQDGGNILVFVDHDFNLEEYLQVIERIGPVRQAQSGHPRSVFVHHIVARDTVDELAMARRETKREVQDLLLEALRARG